MTNNEAIDILRNAAWLGTSADREQIEEAVEMAINALQAQDLNKQVTGKLNFADDTVSRKAALDWLKNEWNGMVTSLFDGIKALSSAQPERKMLDIKEYLKQTKTVLLTQDAFNELMQRAYAQSEIIRCKDCKHQVKEWRTDKRLKDKGYMVCGCDVVGDACGYWALLGQDDDYCSFAERKTDGRSGQETGCD